MKTVALMFLTALYVQADVGSADSCKHAGDALFVKPGCGSLLGDCLKRKSPPDLAGRLSAFRTWLCEKGKPCDEIAKDLRERYETLVDTCRRPIDAAKVRFVGPSGSAVTVIMYVSMSCPLCKKLYADLQDSLSEGGLTREVRIGVKPFSTTPKERMLVAAGMWDRQDELLRELAPFTERLTEKKIADVAASLGIPRKEFLEEAGSARTGAVVDSSHYEAVRNGVEVTPTFFINGVRYRSYKDTRWVLDAIRYRLGRISAP